MINRDPAIYTSVDSLRRLQYRARGFSFLPHQPVNSILSGKNVSKLRGRGLNFEEMRQYQLGDDIRTMDWKVTMRTGKPHVKVFTEERERNVYLLIDQRLNMFFGSKGKMKSVIAAEVAALCAWQTLASTDRIGALVFNDKKAVSMPPKRSGKQVVDILSEVVKQNHALETGKTAIPHGQSLNRVFEKMLRLSGHDGLIIMISDGRGWDDSTTEYIKKLRQHNELLICHVVDPLELALPELDQMILSDGELQMEIRSSDRKRLENYKQGIENQMQKLTQIAAKHRIPVLPFETISETAKQMRSSLGKING